MQIKQIRQIIILSKVLEKHVHTYLNDYLEKCQLFHPFQYGLSCKYSCNAVLACFTNSWLTAMNKSEVSGVVFLDPKKAFDFVDHNILLKKLTIYLNIHVLCDFLNIS